MLTKEQLVSIMPGIPKARRDAFLPFLQAAMTEFAIEAPARAAAFLAQLAHESGQFQFMEELWGPTTAQQRYEPASTLATDLGNTQAGDGKRYKGRGPIQITGRANYTRFGDLLGADLVSEPARAALPEIGFRVAGLFWQKKGLNELADRATDDAFREITKRINGGFNGLEERRRFYAVARNVLGVVQPPVTRGSVRGLPELADEPVFERGIEAIRRQAPKSRSPRKAAGTRKGTRTRKRAGTRKAAATRNAGASRRTTKRKTAKSTTAKRKKR